MTEDQPRDAIGQFGTKPHSDPEVTLVDVPRPLTQVKLNNYNRMVEVAMEPSRRDDYLLDPPYQRGSVWTVEQRRNLIRSILIGLPIGAIAVNDRGWQGADQPSFAVIDGRQRIEALRAFRDGEFGIPAHWLEPAFVVAADEDGNVRWDGTSRPFQRKFENRPLPFLEAQVEKCRCGGGDLHASQRRRYRSGGIDDGGRAHARRPEPDDPQWFLATAHMKKR